MRCILPFTFLALLVLVANVRADDDKATTTEQPASQSSHAMRFRRAAATSAPADPATTAAAAAATASSSGHRVRRDASSTAGSTEASNATETTAASGGASDSTATTAAAVAETGATTAAATATTEQRIKSAIRAAHYALTLVGGLQFTPGAHFDFGMRLVSHNLISSGFLKGVKEGYPLALIVSHKVVLDEETKRYDPSFVRSIMPRLEYGALKGAATACGEAEGLPDQLPEDWKENDDLLRKLHRILVEIDVVTGTLTCPESGRVFEIRDGIPNMLANEDEVA